MKSLLLMLPFSNVFYISSNTQSVIDSMKFLYGKYAICCTDEINEFKIKDAIAIQVCFVGRFNMPFLVVYADRQIITDVPIQVITSIIFNQTRFDCEARNIEKERRLEVILPFKGLFIHNNINGFGLEIYVGVNGGLYYWSNGSKPYHNPARFGYVALHP